MYFLRVKKLLPCFENKFNKILIFALLQFEFLLLTFNLFIMNKSILIPLLFLCGYNNQVSSHNLPHQEVLSNMSCNHNADASNNINLKAITLSASQIERWFVHEYELPESLIRSLPDDCTVYDGGNGIGIVDNTCGNTDHFMMAAQAAIGYCRANGGLSPFFLGPQNFVSASDEETFGVHHQDYNLDQGIKFFCVELCNEASSEEATE